METSTALGRPRSEPARRAVLDAALRLVDWTSELRDFADTAALVAGLDLVISVDTAVAHLAATLGKPVWLMISWVPDWRWMMGRDDSPWYPTLRLFRQSADRQWEPVIAAVARELQKMAVDAGARR